MKHRRPPMPHSQRANRLRPTVSSHSRSHSYSGGRCSLRLPAPPPPQAHREQGQPQLLVALALAGVGEGEGGEGRRWRRLRHQLPPSSHRCLPQPLCSSWMMAKQTLEGPPRRSPRRLHCMLWRLVRYLFLLPTMLLLVLPPSPRRRCCLRLRREGGSAQQSRWPLQVLVLLPSMPRPMLKLMIARQRAALLRRR